MPPQLRETTSLKTDEKVPATSQCDDSVAILSHTRHLVRANGSILGSEVAKTIEPLFPSFVSAIPRTASIDESSAVRPALASIDGRLPITHARVHDFCVGYFAPVLHHMGFGRGSRIAVILPNGPELALCILATVNCASCVPLSANAPPSELEADLQRCGADLVISPYSSSSTQASIASTGGCSPEDSVVTAAMAAARDQFSVLRQDTSNANHKAFTAIQQSVEKLGIPFIGLVPSPSEAGIFRLVDPSDTTHSALSPLALDFHNDRAAAAQFAIKNPSLGKGNAAAQLNITSDEALVLFTSGTTGNKKLVPHRMGAMLTAATTIALSWDLSPMDVNCNLMPLFHVGGIVRQVFSPMISGGCVICCPSFDPSIFWALLANRAFTWYYAAPTMHQIILQTHDAVQCPDPRLRMIANAAGGLLPSLAVQLRERFDHACVLPSYGMTECMPISSPPATYDLTRPGTSGVAVGPEIAILNTLTMKPLPPGSEGPICVRGEPCFRGYGKLANEESNPGPSESFLPGGWFNTGDLGYLDKDGYIYITGRSKEVINRGGEIISPMEVEEAIYGHAHVKACAAFSTKHDVLQEVVGVALVMEPEMPRLDLKSLHAYLGDRLAAPKWPQCIVFLDDLPRNNTNKLLRVKLGQRFGLPELSDSMTYIDRTFEGQCPPAGTSLEIPIQVRRVSVSAKETEKSLKAALCGEGSEIRVKAHPERPGLLVCYLYNVDKTSAIKVARSILHGYAVPSHYVQVDLPFSSFSKLPSPTVMDAAETILDAQSSYPVDADIRKVQDIFVAMLNLDHMPTLDTNFFHVGGSSMLASQLASKMRKEFEISCSGADIFHNPTPKELVEMARNRSSSKSEKTTSAGPESNFGGIDFSNTGASTATKRLPIECSWWAMLFQLVPMFVVFPIWQVTRYLLFFATLLRSLDVVPNERNKWTFILAYLFFHFCWVTFTPLVFVAIKWIIIGRYKPGRHPIWSSYYLRWWFVDVCRQLFLRGVWGSNTMMLNFYYRLLGAKIGKGARISLEAEVAEFDLVTIGDNASVEMSTVRGFGVDNGAMILGQVTVGHQASVGVRSVVAPNTSIPDNCHLGPATSSRDMKAYDDNFARVNRQRLPEPCILLQILVAAPIGFLVNCVSQLPPLIVLVWMLMFKSGRTEIFNTPSDLMEWLCDFRRIPFYVGIRVARALLSPIFYMAAALVVKKFVIGKFEPGPRDTDSQWQLLRHHLSARLFSRKRIQNVADIVGRHYEVVSCLYRLLGAKIGKRVFWPGHQPVFSGEFDLLEVGDDVVFGSRSFLFCTTTDSCEKVVLCAGANVADNCVVLPGSVVGKSATLGSNSICPEGWYLPEGSVWFGAQGGQPSCLEEGVSNSSLAIVKPKVASAEIPKSEMPMIGDSSTLRPFGRAFYQRKATYFVWNLSGIICFSVVMKAFIAFFHSLPLLISIHGASLILYGRYNITERRFQHHQVSFLEVYNEVLYCYFWVNIIRVAAWLAVELTAKWTILGKRQIGTYNYDTSSYCQRWELYQLICKIRKFSRFTFLQFFYGTPFMNYYFRLNGGKVGSNVCLYPAGADPFMPEPDLVTIGDQCLVDNASLVCHLNTRGNFNLATITVEQSCTLQTRSRIQQGVWMESGSQLLAKSVAMTGEVIERNSVWVGCPASLWYFLSPIEGVNGTDGDSSYHSGTLTTRVSSFVTSSSASSNNDDLEDNVASDERERLLAADRPRNYNGV